MPRRPTIDRRRFLGSGLAGLSLAATAPHFLGVTSRAFAGEQGDDHDRVLVVLQLSGGNDGLSTVVPFGDDAYYANRRAAAIPRGEVLRLDDGIGLHPALGRLHAIYGEGHAAIVQGVSYPNPNRSHFKSMDVWHAGDLGGRQRSTGWIGRAVDACCSREEAGPNLVINFGERVPYALEARIHKPVSFKNVGQYRWTGNPRDERDFEKLNDEAPESGSEKGSISWLHRVAVDARQSSRSILQAAEGHRPSAAYPSGQLASDLRTVAALIGSGLGTRVYYVSFGGFDTHNNQRNRHDNLMRQLDAAVGAFWKDLTAQRRSRDVLMVAFSEFGRRVKENGSAGTDHGVAGPMFLIGDSVRGGLHGAQPSLTDLDKGDLRMGIDFRSVYATVLDRWMAVDSKTVLGLRFEHVGLLP